MSMVKQDNLTSQIAINAEYAGVSPGHDVSIKTSEQPEHFY